MKTVVKFSFLRKKRTPTSRQREASSRNCVIGRVSCYRCARSRSEESVSGGIAGASARENICEFSYRKPLFTFAYSRRPILTFLSSSKLSSTRSRSFVLFPRELYASRRKFSRRKIQERRDEYPWFLFLSSFRQKISTSIPDFLIL